LIDTFHSNSFLNEEELSYVKEKYETFCRLYEEKWVGQKIKVTELYTNGHSHTKWLDDRIVCYSEKISESGEYLPVPTPDYKSDEWQSFMKDIKDEFDKEEYDSNIKNILETRLKEHGVTDPLVYFGVWDLRYWFTTHTDGPDIISRHPRPNSWSDWTEEDWDPKDGFVYSHQGLINLEVEESSDGTVIFNQRFPWSTYIDYELTIDQPMSCGTTEKDAIRFCKGEEPKRFNAEITNFTHRDMSEDDHDWVMELCYDDSMWPIAKGYGLSVKDVLTFDTPGTGFGWRSDLYHMTRPCNKNGKKRLTLSFVCGRHT